MLITFFFFFFYKPTEEIPDATRSHSNEHFVKL